MHWLPSVDSHIDSLSVTDSVLVVSVCTASIVFYVDLLGLLESLSVFVEIGVITRGGIEIMHSR